MRGPWSPCYQSGAKGLNTPLRGYSTGKARGMHKAPCESRGTRRRGV